MWFNEQGRLRLCETGINGVFDPIKVCHSGINGLQPIKTSLSTCSGYLIEQKGK